MRLGLDPDRNVLYDRINQRAQRMFDGGLVEETRSLLEKYGTAARPLSALGYKQAVALVRGEIDRKTAVQTAQQAHRNYAKRQMTWFRREPDVIWISGFGDDTRVQSEAIRKITDIQIVRLVRFSLRPLRKVFADKNLPRKDREDAKCVPVSAAKSLAARSSTPDAGIDIRWPQAWPAPRAGCRERVLHPSLRR